MDTVVFDRHPHPWFLTYQTSSDLSPSSFLCFSLFKFHNLFLWVDSITQAEPPTPIFLFHVELSLKLWISSCLVCFVFLSNSMQSAWNIMNSIILSFTWLICIGIGSILTKINRFSPDIHKAFCSFVAEEIEIALMRKRLGHSNWENGVSSNQEWQFKFLSFYTRKQYKRASDEIAWNLLRFDFITQYQRTIWILSWWDLFDSGNHCNKKMTSMEPCTGHQSAGVPT